jgi:hypothetical protein
MVRGGAKMTVKDLGPDGGLFVIMHEQCMPDNKRGEVVDDEPVDGIGDFWDGCTDLVPVSSPAESRVGASDIMANCVFVVSMANRSGRWVLKEAKGLWMTIPVTPLAPICGYRACDHELPRSQGSGPIRSCDADGRGMFQAIDDHCCGPTRDSGLSWRLDHHSSSFTKQASVADAPPQIWAER